MPRVRSQQRLLIGLFIAAGLVVFSVATLRGTAMLRGQTTGGVCQTDDCTRDTNGDGTGEGDAFCKNDRKQCFTIDDLPCIVCMEQGSRPKKKPRPSSAGVAVCRGDECSVDMDRDLKGDATEYCRNEFGLRCRNVDEIPCTRCEGLLCGDGTTDDGEECDDGNADNADSCTNKCLRPRCGDGALQPGEECRDGGTACAAGTSCVVTACKCRVISCGNGSRDGEEVCDDGNRINDDDCTTLCSFPACGDGILQRTKGEQCDDGNLTDEDGCSALCAKERTSSSASSASSPLPASSMSNGSGTTVSMSASPLSMSGSSLSAGGSSATSASAASSASDSSKQQ